MTRGTCRAVRSRRVRRAARAERGVGDPADPVGGAAPCVLQNDCWVRAWLQFGRAPEIRDNVISDLRYSGPTGRNFTTMPIGQSVRAATVRANLTDWRPPRADLLAIPERVSTPVVVMTLEPHGHDTAMLRRSCAILRSFDGWEEAIEVRSIGARAAALAALGCRSVPSAELPRRSRPVRGALRSPTRSRTRRGRDSAVIYEVNVRQYTPEGTLAALRPHLPRLKALGVDILWLMPVQPIGVKNRKGTLGQLLLDLRLHRGQPGVRHDGGLQGARRRGAPRRGSR